MITYETIKQLAKDSGVSIADLCALNPKNDPFYTGRPAEVVAAEWGLYRDQGVCRKPLSVVYSVSYS